MNNEQPFNLFADCQLVKGFSRSTICDLGKNQIHLIPNSLYDILIAFNGKTIQEVKDNFDPDDDQIIDEYFQMLLQERLIFFSKDKDLFPTLNLQWDAPSDIIYAIIDIGKTVQDNIERLVEQLDSLDCKYVEIRCYDILSFTQVETILQSFNGTTVISIGLLLKFDTTVSREQWMNVADNFQRVTSLILHTSPIKEEIYSPRFRVPLTYQHLAIRSEQCCGVISHKAFLSHVEVFTESQKFNTCLNRKLGIDQYGNIKNCPSMKVSYGNIADHNLKDVVYSKEFMKVWEINKDAVDGCKICEFRHVCTDCRAFIDDPEDKFSKPLKCGYDPLSCQWELWSENPLKLGAIRHYGLQEV